MSSIIKNGDTFHGISVEGRGVFQRGTQYKSYTRTYAGQCKDAYACGLGVLADFDGTKEYAEHGPDGELNGRNLRRDDDGLSTWYCLFERGKLKDIAGVFANGTCSYNYEDCAPDDPRLLALMAQVAPVEALAKAVATEAEEAVARMAVQETAQVAQRTEQRRQQAHALVAVAAGAVLLAAAWAYSRRRAR